MTSASFNRPGAVDLSALKQKAQQSAGPGQSVVGGGYVVEVTEQTFEAETIRRSMKHPVVVELYSPRVPTGQQLSDILAEIANSSGGKFLLARLNVDTAPGIVQALGLQAVPTVIALIGGQVAPLFQGVLPADQVQAAIDQLLKAAVANGIVGRADPTGGPPPAETEEEESLRSTRVSRPPTRLWPGATSLPRSQSSTSCSPPTRATSRPRPARPRRRSSPGRPGSTRRSCWPPRGPTTASAYSWMRPTWRW